MIRVEFREVESLIEKVEDLWVVLVRVKQGNPRELYHIIEIDGK